MQIIFALNGQIKFKINFQIVRHFLKTAGGKSII